MLRSVNDYSQARKIAKKQNNIYNGFLVGCFNIITFAIVEQFLQFLTGPISSLISASKRQFRKFKYYLQ